MSGLNAALANMSQQLQSQQTAAAESSRASARSAAADKPAAAADDSGDEDVGGGGGGQDDDDSPIQVFCRIRPSRGAAVSKSVLAVDPHEKQVEFNMSKLHADSAHNTINNSREQFKFHFNGLFDQNTSQATMFDAVGKRVIDNVTAGYNGTIFAYGQTVSSQHSDAHRSRSRPASLHAPAAPADTIAVV